MKGLRMKPVSSVDVVPLRAPRQRAEMPGNPSTPIGTGIGKRPNTPATYQKVLDARKRPVRGLWVRNDRFYARVAIPDPGTGVTQMLRVPLEKAGTVAEAQAALRRLLIQREDKVLPPLGQTPKLRDYVPKCFAHYEAAKHEKRVSTLISERAHMNAWLKQLGGVRLHRIIPKMVDQFITRRQAEGAAPRTVNLDVTCLRNVLIRAVKEGLMKSVAFGDHKPLKCEPRKRDLFTDAQVEEICAAGFRSRFNGGELAKPGTTGVPLKNAQQFADFVRLLARCGSRMSETLRLKWSDVQATGRVRLEAPGHRAGVSGPPGAARHLPAHPQACTGPLPTGSAGWAGCAANVSASARVWPRRRKSRTRSRNIWKASSLTEPATG